MSRNPPPKGQGAARAKQMGLLLDLNPDGDLDDHGGNEEELEAELLALMGGGGGGKGGPVDRKVTGKTLVAMEEIEKMAALCMKDLDEDGEDDDGDLESDSDLLAELREVMEDDEEPPLRKPLASPVVPQRSQNAPDSLESRLQQRMDMYQTAISNANAAGDTSKVRRYDRGLKTLQSMLTSVKKGKPINEDEIPPPVVIGGKPSPAVQCEPIRDQESPSSTSPQENHVKQESKPVTPKILEVTPDTPAISPLTPGQPNSHLSELKASVLNRQREYKMAAIQAKQSGNIEQAKQLYLVAKKLDSVVESVDKGELTDVHSLPPPPGSVPPQSSSKPAVTPTTPSPASATATAVSAPRSVAEALQQRMDRYIEASESAKSRGDERKSRMHQRIVKQYQDALRAHKAGQPVDLAELPVPPGMEGEQNIVSVLETAMKLANQDAEADEDEPQTEATKPSVPKSRAPPPPKASSAAGTPTNPPKLGGKAQQQLDFLSMRRQQFVKAALRSKEMKDRKGAAQHLRNAKGLEPMINTAKAGLPVDISKVPAAPISGDDYRLSQSRSSSLSPRSAEQYVQLMAQLKQQHEKCLTYSQQFTHMGNVGETVRFEKLAEECLSSIEVLKKCHAKGRSVPRCHTEERTFNTVKMFPDLTSNDLQLVIVKGINLPSAGTSASDLDASVRFEFPFPSAEGAQRDRTNTVRNTNCPEFREKFKLNIKRDHRSFKRVVQTKGIKFEVVHKGGLFKADKVVGTAQLKLESLENQCEIRDIIDVLDGRKATGGKLEVRVMIREPLSGAQLHPLTEKWLVVQSSTPSPDNEQPPPPKSNPKNHQERNSKASSSSEPYKLHSFSLLSLDKERLESKMSEYKRSGRDPSDLMQQHRDVCQRLQWQKNYLEKHPHALTEYENVLRKFVHGLSESVKTLSSQGNREAAKESLARLKKVENELEAVRRKRGSRD